MDKTIVGLIAAVGALAPMAASPASASVTSSDVNAAMQAKTFDDLLQPIPNALALLKVADDAAPLSAAEGVQLAQYHHHHHHHYRRFFSYHHHHHHYRYYHHHHHHHHHYYNY